MDDHKHLALMVGFVFFFIGLAIGYAIASNIEKATLYRQMISDQATLYNKMLVDEQSAHAKTLELVGIVDQAKATIVEMCEKNGGAECVESIQPKVVVK